jgi:hypothetical protein
MLVHASFAQGGWVVADNCLGTRRMWIDMIGELNFRQCIYWNMLTR